jgi:tRNA-dihydrouridine synthase A
MMRRTDRHFRYFMRLLTRETLLYSEMVVDQAILKGDREHLIGYSEAEHPLVLQVGGSDPDDMAECARIAEDWGYDEININVGCPSSRVQKGDIGVCLMGEPETVAGCVEAMRQASELPVTVKHRIGFDERDSFGEMAEFVRTVAEAGCRRFTIHARKAWLDGLSPADNRNVPPLRYEDIYRLKEEFPPLDIEINGGVESLDEVEAHLEHVDAAMIGRAAYNRPYLFAEADRRIFGVDHDPPSRLEVAREMADYAEWWLSEGGKLSHIAHHIMQLYSHQHGAGAWREHLGEHAGENDPAVIVEAAERAEQRR